MLRNMVTSLIEHEQIKTTLPKARDAARLAEKMITLGKKGNLPAYRRANAFILKPALVPKVFGALAQRYADRPGGYTRIHKFGNRPGDNAPQAILELVDNPRDLRFELTARSVGWEMLGRRVGDGDAKDLINSGIRNVDDIVEKEKSLRYDEPGATLRLRTRTNLQKVLRYRKDDAIHELRQKANEHIETLLAKPVASRRIIAENETKKDKDKANDNKIIGISLKALNRKAGERMPGEHKSPLQLARGSLGRQPSNSWWDRRKLGIDRSEFWTRV